MKKIAFVFLFGSLFLAGCPDHDVIPSPTPHVELESHFEGVIDGVDKEFTENVSGYYLDATKSMLILSAPDTSKAVYSAEMKSGSANTAIRISVGSICWDASDSPEPTKTMFNNFFVDPVNLSPAYSVGSANGFEVVYTDEAGGVWTSDVAGGNAEFVGVTQGSDSTGDYSKFTCTFNCTVKRTVMVSGSPVTYSKQISNAVFKGWFKR